MNSASPGLILIRPILLPDRDAPSRQRLICQIDGFARGVRWRAREMWRTTVREHFACNGRNNAFRVAQSVLGKFSRHHVELVLDLRIAGRRGRRNGCRRRATGGSCFMTGGGGPQRNADLGIMAGLALSTLLVPVAAAEVQS